MRSRRERLVRVWAYGIIIRACTGKSCQDLIDLAEDVHAML